MYTIIKKIILKTIRVRQKIMRCYYRDKTLIMANLKGVHCELGKDILFEVPVHVNGRGHVLIKDNVGLGYPLSVRLGNGDILLQARREKSELVIGKNSYLSNNTSIIACAKIEIGEKCLIGDGVTIMDSDFHDINPLTRHSGKGGIAPIKIGDNVFIGSRAFVLKGVSIGDNSVIAPMSVVTKNIPKNKVAGGIPAKLIQDI